MKKNKLGSLIVLIVLLLLFVVGIGLIAKYTGADKYFGEFRVEYNGKVLKGTDNSVISSPDGKATFYVKGTNGYTVEVVPNIDFKYTVDEQTCNFKDEDFSGIVVGKYDDCFIVNISTKVEDFLSEIWGGATVTVPEDLNVYCYKLVVTSSTNGAVIEIAIGYRFTGSVKINSGNFYF